MPIPASRRSSAVCPRIVGRCGVVISRACCSEPTQFGQIPLGVTLTNVDGQIGDSLCVQRVLA
jgi:hypothetical protein